MSSPSSAASPSNDPPTHLDANSQASPAPDPPPQASSALVGTTCMELALEGERLCKNGDFKNGVGYFEKAIEVGTNDDRTLSAIYSQLGNAYYYMADYQKALEFHRLDVTLVHNIGDERAEAKACGNLGNTFKMLDKFDEAAVYCRRYLEISRKLEDPVGEGKALYNLGNVYYTQGRRMIGSSDQDPVELSDDIKKCLLRAIEYYEMNLKVVSKLNDFASMGRAYGNLGNTHFVLGNFEAAVENHTHRLELARKTNDNCAERRAHINLGNANVFSGKFLEAIENYSATLKLAQDIQDKYAAKNIADSCYSLANTYTFIRDYKSAIKYHLKYLDLIKDNEEEKLGEGRACWSLVNIYLMVNEPENALVYAKKHYAIAELLGDRVGLESAKLNIEELQETISQKQAAMMACSSAANTGSNLQSDLSANRKYNADIIRLTPDKRQEQEQRRFKKQLNSNLAPDIDGLAARRRAKGGGPARSNSNERLFDLIAHFQSGRIDDQRCEMLNMNQSNLNSTSVKSKHQTNTDLNDKENQSSATSETRSSQPSITTNPINVVSSAIKNTYRKASLAAYPTSFITPSVQSQRRPTVSHEHREQLFDIIAGAQGQRMDEQRASLPALTFANGVLRNPMNAGLLSRGNTVDHNYHHNHQQSIAPNARSVSGKHIDKLPETISEDRPLGREKSNSIVPTTTTSFSRNDPTPSTAKPPGNRPQKLTRLFQTMDAGAPAVHDERFFDSLMKYQSTRLNDQRSEFPNNNKTPNNLAQGPNSKRAGQSTDLFNQIVKFQSDRIEDQRSEPPARSRNQF